MHGRNCFGHAAIPQMTLVRKLGAAAEDIGCEEVGHFVVCTCFEEL